MGVAGLWQGAVKGCSPARNGLCQVPVNEGNVSGAPASVVLCTSIHWEDPGVSAILHIRKQL